MNAKPPLLCVYCGAETIAKEPCPRCERPWVAGEWTEVARGAHARGVAVATLVLLIGPWCIPISWMLGGIALLFHAAGVEPPVLKVTGDPMPLGGMIALGLLMPALAVVVGIILRDLTAKVIGDLLDTDWHHRPPRPQVTMLATTRGTRLLGARGVATLCEGDPVTGADVCAADVAAAGAAEVAGLLGNDERDVLFAAALAGMIARGEIEVRRSRTFRWEHGSPTTEHTGWDVRVVRSPESSGATEKKLAAAVEHEHAHLLEVHRVTYGTTEDAEQRGEPSAAIVADRLRAWTKAEPDLYREIVEMGEGQRSD